MWDLREPFGEVISRSDPRAKIACAFKGGAFSAEIVSHRQGRQFRLFVDEGLRAALAETFLMSYMRALDAGLASTSEEFPQDGGDNSERSFWEFVDFEFDAAARHMRIVAHYVQRPAFPRLFQALTNSPQLRRINHQLQGKAGLRIYKQRWRARDQFGAEVGAKNVIYMLADMTRGLLYVGEADDLVARFRGGHARIPEWTHYRYDLLPPEMAQHRVTLERMLICDIDALFGQWASDLPLPPSGFRLVNVKVDR